MILLGPYNTTTDGATTYRAPPAGCQGAINLAGLGGRYECALFACREIPKGWDGAVLSSEDSRDARPDAKILSAWESLTGYRPQGETLADLVWDHLTSGADPLGLDQPGPLVPTAKGDLELWLGGLVRRERFRWGAHSHTVKLRDTLGKQLAAVRLRSIAGGCIEPITQRIEFDYHRRVLDACCEKYGIDAAAVLPPSWPAGETRLQHATTLSENFNTADSTTLGPTYSWNEYRANTSGVGWEVLSNEARINDTTSTYNSARCEADLSGTDQYAQIVARTIGSGSANYQWGACVRFDDSVKSFIGVRCLQASDTIQIFSYSGSSFTILSPTPPGITPAAGDVVRIQASGTTISSWLNGVMQESLTDTTPMANLRTGIGGYTVGMTIDDFEAGDIPTGGVGQPPRTMHQFRMRCG